MSRAQDRLPVIIGVGQINDRPSDPTRGLDSLGLMQAALHAADGDAGGGWLARLDSLAGEGAVETYTVLYERNGSPRCGAIVGRTRAGARFLAKVGKQDEAGIAFLTDGRMQPVGSAGHTIEDSDGDAVWIAHP